MARYVICSSPLVKIYLLEWHDRLLAEPEEMNNFGDPKAPWKFDVPRGCSSFKMTFNKPVPVTGRDDSEIETLYKWLIGESGHSQHETDLFGIVPFDPGVDLVERQDEIARLTDLMEGDDESAALAMKELAQIQKETQTRIRDMREAIKDMSAARIKRAMKQNHNNLVKQWEINEEMKMGKHRPSESEALGAYALDAEIQAAAAKGAKVYGNINRIMAHNQATS